MPTTPKETATEKKVEQLLDTSRQLNLIDLRNCRGDHVETDSDLELNVRCKRPPRVLQLPLMLVRQNEGLPRNDQKQDEDHEHYIAKRLIDGFARGVAALAALRTVFGGGNGVVDPFSLWMWCAEAAEGAR